MKLDNISVCICTYKRPEMLARALDLIIAQVTDSAFALELVIVENDKTRSAQELVQKYQENGSYRIVYDCEPEKNIALARNRSIRNASGNLIAFIDDDEFPAENWLYEMYRCLKEYAADGVLGPVLPHFPVGAPEWLAKSRLCERPRNATGSPVRAQDLRTGNVLFQRSVFENDEKWFDPAMGLTGGSDGKFLSSQIDRGCRFIWCDEALVFETVSEERWHAGFYLRKNFRIGALDGELFRLSRATNAVLISCLLFLGYSALLPFSVLRGKHIWMNALAKIYYNGACLLSFLNLMHAPRRR